MSKTDLKKSAFPSQLRSAYFFPLFTIRYPFARPKKNVLLMIVIMKTFQSTHTVPIYVHVATKFGHVPK